MRVRVVNMNCTLYLHYLVDQLCSCLHGRKFTIFKSGCYQNTSAKISVISKKQTIGSDE